MPDAEPAIQVTAGISVTPGPVTLAAQAEPGTEPGDAPGESQ